MKKYILISSLTSIAIVFSALFFIDYLHFSILSILSVFLIILSAFQAWIFNGEAKKSDIHQFQSATIPADTELLRDPSNDEYSDLFRLHSIVKILSIPLFVFLIFYLTKWWKLLAVLIYLLGFIAAKIIFEVKHKKAK